MRLLSVRLLNLNSLRGAHELRFDRPPLADCGVFLIAGPTGAGKSTLLDALTLALYGRAARYGKASPEEMMSRHTGESLAEVEFETRGHTYRAVWRMRRARGKAGGNLQPVERRLVSLADEKPLAEKAGEVDAQIEALTGLDYDRFLRSVLLAQGQFATFLKARPAERAELLEKITGTEIYSTLSQLAHLEHAARQQTVETLRLQIAAKPVLSEEARAAEEQALGSAQDSAAECAAQTRTARAAWDEMEKHLAGQREMVKAGQAAEGFGKTATECATQLATQAPTLAAAAETSAQAAAARVAREPLWKQVVELDATLKQQALAAAGAAEAGTKARTSFSTACEAEARAIQSVEQARQAAESVRTWLADHVGDATLEEALPSLREAAEAWREAVQARAQAEKTAQTAAQWLRTADAAAATAMKLGRELAAARMRHSETGALVEKLTAQRDARRLDVENALRLQSFDEHRAQLVAGERCPLCGAAEHPFATAAAGDRLVAQAGEARRVLAALETELAASQKEVTALVSTLSQLETKAAAECEAEESARGQIAALSPPDGEALAALGECEALCGDRMRRGFEPWDVRTDRSDETAAVLSALQRRAQTFSAAQKKDADAERTIARVTAALTAAHTERERTEAALRQAETEAAETARTLQGSREARVAVFGEAAVDGDRARFEQTVREAQTTLEAARQLETQIKTQQTEAQTRQQEALRRKHELEAQWAGRAPVSDEARAWAQQSMLALEEALTAKNEEVGRRRQTLKIDDDTCTALAAAAKGLAAAEAGVARWARLRELIGSADGSKFSRFAQTLTLRQLVSRANHHLTQLAPRYRLIAAEGEELDLRIVDLFQANADRPMESLSGGESFLASLALALGLSELASRHHPIDSLFIDEGFGTLDAGTLEIALAALENLPSRGKTVGLISHVDLLKERLGTRIEVEKGPDGTSTLRVL